jgi:ribosomal protein L14E/L6E/L27E
MEKAQIVRSLAGHDRGELFCVMDTEDDFLFLADGKHRKVENPKRKRVKHVESVGEYSHPTIEKLRAGQPVGNQELRRALAALRDQMEV